MNFESRGQEALSTRKLSLGHRLEAMGFNEGHMALEVIDVTPPVNTAVDIILLYVVFFYLWASSIIEFNSARLQFKEKKKTQKLFPDHISNANSSLT